MSFNRLAYDECEEKNKVMNSMKVGMHGINTPINCNTCFQNNPTLINQHGGVSMSANKDWRFYSGPIDVESDLLNINRPATMCPSGKYQPKCPNCGVIVSGEPCGKGVELSCYNCKTKIPLGGMCNQNLVNFPDCNFPTEDTRLTNPPSTLRGTGWNRFEELCLDPQANLFLPEDKFNSMTRMQSKDNFKPCFRKVNINSMNPNEQYDDSCWDIKNSRFGTPMYLRKDRCK